MFNKSKVGLSVLVLILAGMGAWAVQEAQPKGEREAKRYKVTPWPADSADRNFQEHVEQHLNEMAGQGWEFHSVMQGQPSRLMIFRRS